jgi:hypothetical protein
LGAWDLTQLIEGFGQTAVALDERFLAEEDLMTQPFPNAVSARALADELRIVGSGSRTAAAELAE